MQRLSRLFEKVQRVREITQNGGRIYCQYVFAAQCSMLNAPINVDELITALQASMSSDALM